MEKVEESHSELTDIAIEITKYEKQKRKKRRKNERDLWDKLKKSNIHIIGILQSNKRSRKNIS